MSELFRKSNNTFIGVSLSGGDTSNTIYTNTETEIGTWTDGKPLYRSVYTPTTLVLDNNIGDPYYKTYVTDIFVYDISEIVNSTVLGVTDTTKFNIPCYTFLHNGRLAISSFATVTIDETSIKIVLEYTKNEPTNP